LYYLCSPEHILLNFRHPCMRCDASSDGRATALPVIYMLRTAQIVQRCR
jgi:hypothetical protein